MASKDDGFMPRNRQSAVAMLATLEAIRDHPGATLTEIGEYRGRGRLTAGRHVNQAHEKGWVKPDRDLPAHWTITKAGETILTNYGHLLD
jgi:DNA-binding MarR family transcriptional regulator